MTVEDAMVVVSDVVDEDIWMLAELEDAVDVAVLLVMLVELDEVVDVAML